MKYFYFTTTTLFATLSLNAAIQVDTLPEEPLKTPFIEYHNRMAVFNLDHLSYERIRTNAFYVGIEGWQTREFNHTRRIAEGEFRLGYNYFWNGRDHFTPIVGLGFFRDFHKEYLDGHRRIKSGIFYGTVGFLYDHEFTSVFNLGLNIKGIIGGPVSEKHSDWGTSVLGTDVSVPITFRFGNKRHWDLRIEPFDIYLYGSRISENYFGCRSTIGYRF